MGLTHSTWVSDEGKCTKKNQGMNARNKYICKKNQYTRKLRTSMDDLRTQLTLRALTHISECFGPKAHQARKIKVQTQWTKRP